MSYLNAPFWYKLEIDLKKLNLIENPITISDYLRYYRKLYNLSRRQLEINSAISLNAIKSYEDKHIYPTREVSRKLSNYFNLNTKYFFDPFYEYEVNIVQALKDYRGNNTYKDTAAIIGVHAHTWRDWENEKHAITRENFYKLKGLGILP
ncbi:helix-turn-helix transcriptional regulator [Clostridium sp. D53t1_180928_C8]|uniref:helix-turn-helix domain-containing protein n=1 Tax=Clostridium sp. D53t1_180928_C8 TaxID=2787101 RepID=UPI0018AA77DA|nr:helix-turn-helix transcriptional regulator [Clostridium sp. D53t1_180928_C8]